jgi:hypothetical protein
MASQSTTEPPKRKKRKKPHPERVVDPEQFQLFTDRRAAWVRTLRAIKEQIEGQGMQWQAIVADV